MAGLFLTSSARILKQALTELRSGNVTSESLLEHRH
jgi:hypothetical protein